MIIDRPDFRLRGFGRSPSPQRQWCDGGNVIRVIRRAKPFAITRGTFIAIHRISEAVSRFCGFARPLIWPALRQKLNVSFDEGNSSVRFLDKADRGMTEIIANALTR